MNPNPRSATSFLMVPDICMDLLSRTYCLALSRPVRAGPTASAAGLAALLVASQPLFLAVRLVGAAYLVFLGLQALYGALARRDDRRNSIGAVLPARLRRLVAYRQGLISNLSNPKIVVFFLS